MSKKSYTVEGDFHDVWKKGKAVLTKDSLKIHSHPVMERWEAPFMKKLAEVATSNGGDVLEIGFGLGLSASYVQQSETINNHVIIEANMDVFQSLLEFSKTAKHNVIPLFGKWQELVPFLNSAVFDGILYDTYPLNTEEMHNHQFNFIKEAQRLLKPNGILTYCNLTSWGNLRDKFDNKELFQQTQLPYLKEIGFLNCTFQEFNITPPDSCDYYQYNDVVVPIVRK